jgi:hypothetical protein
VICVSCLQTCSSDVICVSCLQTCSSEWCLSPYVQGGSNMTGTNCDLFTHNQSRSYLNHLVSSASAPWNIELFLRCVLVASVWFWESTLINSLNDINRLVFVMETLCFRLYEFWVPIGPQYLGLYYRKKVLKLSCIKLATNNCFSTYKYAMTFVLTWVEIFYRRQ